jgi:hypothetical protein
MVADSNRYRIDTWLYMGWLYEDNPQQSSGYQ